MVEQLVMDCRPGVTGKIAGPVSPGYTLLSGHAASEHQSRVFDHFRYGRGSAIVKSVAGSGKTTTIKNGVRYLPESSKVLLLAFNTDAAKQLKSAVEELRVAENRSFANVEAKTFHSLGNGAVGWRLRRSGKKVVVEDANGRKCRDLLSDNLSDVEYEGYASFATQLVGYAKGEGVGALLPDTEDQWWRLVDHHGLYLDTDELKDGTEAKEERAVEIARQLLRWSNEAARDGYIDFNDMLYLVIKWRLRLFQQYDVVVADEAQDTNPVRRALLRLALRPGGRLYAVGDPRQSIYGFTGASVDSMDQIARDFNTRELPLTVSYRCAKSVIETAKAWCPYIEHHADAPEGKVVNDIALVEALKLLSPQDAILCRNTKPLVSLAYALIARGRACRIMGREIGQGLVTLIEKQRTKGVDRLIEKLEAFRGREVAKFTARGQETRAQAVSDKVDCVLTVAGSLADNDRTVPGLIRRIEDMFSDTDTGVLTLATVHKAKGQEWPKVAILRPDLMPCPWARQEWQKEQELNLCYVAATRAKDVLIYALPNDEALAAP